MSSGGKQEIINTLERALSTDINRLQLFAAMDRAEIYRFLSDINMGSDDVEASSMLSQTTTLTAPLTAEIFGGFCVRPDVGDTNLAIDPGVLMGVAPDSDSDSSVYKLVRDPGLSNSGGGALSIAANSSGGTRIDVIECSYILNTVETDNRDIFNPATNSFAPASVTKATQAGLSYRVRSGSSGGGYPAAVSGWLPLCVASVPNGSVNNDTVTFWDVRPLLADRVNAPFFNSKFGPSVRNADFSMYTTNVGVTNLIGSVEAVAADVGVGNARLRGLYRLGGNLNRGTPGTDGSLNASDAANCSGSFTNNTPTYVYLLEPFGLPRWARYTDAASGVRNPRNPRGIPVTSQIAPHVWGPGGFGGQPSSAVALPNSTGLGGSTGKGACIAAGIWSTISGTFLEGAGFVSRGREQIGSAGFPQVTGTITGASPSQNIAFSYTAGTHFPANAQSLRLGVTITFTSGTVGSISAGILTQDSGSNVFASGQQIWPVASGGGTFEVIIDVPLTPNGGPFVINFALTETGGSPPVVTGSNANLYGWGI